MGEGQCARKGEQRVIVLPDDFSADLRMPFHLFPFGGGQAAALVQHLCGHAQLADIMQRRGLHDQVIQGGLGAGGLCHQARIVAQTNHPVTHRRAFVILHGACQTAHQLHARCFKLGSAFAHQRLLFAPAIGQFKMVAHARAQHFGVERFDDVIGGAELKSFYNVGRFIFRGQKNHRNFGCCRSNLECAAYIVAAGAGHIDVQQHQIGGGPFERTLER